MSTGQGTPTVDDHIEHIANPATDAILIVDLKAKLVVAADRIEELDLRGQKCRDAFRRLNKSRHRAQARIDQLEAGHYPFCSVFALVPESCDCREPADIGMVPAGDIRHNNKWVATWREADDGRPFDVNTIAKLQVEREADDE